MSDSRTDFEAWSKQEGACNLAAALEDTCEDGRFPATYHYAPTETAWRAWANKPDRAQPERVAMSDAEIAEIAYLRFRIVADDADVISFVNFILAAQAGTQPVIGEAARELDLKDAVIKLYQAPFKFVHGYIQDANFQTVADDYGKDAMLRIRGWGRISYMPEPEKLQDAVGEHIAAALNAYWDAAIAARVGEDRESYLINAAKLASRQLRLWMRDHGQDIASQEAIKAIDAAIAASKGAA